MKDIWRYLLKFFTFLLVLFFIQRLIFLLFRFSELKNIPGSEFVRLLFTALHMDISAACYVLIVPFLFLCLYPFVQWNFIPNVLRYYAVLIIIISAFINICDISLYEA